MDTPIYQRYGEAIADGQVPYRDSRSSIRLAALPVFRLPVEGRDYGATFEGLMAAAGVGVVLLVAALTTSWWAPLFVALSPLLSSPSSSAASTSGRRSDGGGAGRLSRRPRPPRPRDARARDGGEGLSRPAGAASSPTSGGREAGERRSSAGRVVPRRIAAIVLPFALLSPGGVWDAFWVQAGRPLQIESLGSGILLAAHQLFGLDLTMESSHGSQNSTAARQARLRASRHCSRSPR